MEVRGAFAAAAALDAEGEEGGEEGGEGEGEEGDGSVGGRRLVRVEKRGRGGGWGDVLAQ